MKDNNIDRGKVSRLLDFHLQLALLRSKPTRVISDYTRVLWLSDVPHEKECFTRAWDSSEGHELEEWLLVSNRAEPDMPVMPEECTDWVDDLSLEKLTDEPRLKPEITVLTDNPDYDEDEDQPAHIPESRHLEDNPHIQQAWTHYIENEWKPWKKDYLEWEKIHGVYATLFAMQQEKEKLGEEYELVLGLGLLSWNAPNSGRVSRHLVVADAEVHFEAHIGKFTVKGPPSGGRLRPELDMLDLADQPQKAESDAKEVLEDAGDDPWDRDVIEKALKTIVHSIRDTGEYSDSLEKSGHPPNDEPRAEYAPAIILRKRSERGLTEVLKSIMGQVESGEKVPAMFCGIAETGERAVDTQPDDDNGPSNFSDDTVYFPKPANNEQRQIVHKLDRTSGVLVQGPPGTGKSHTIANLISHSLATGQRVLITAKTPRALRVLERQIPEELRPLCINLLGDGASERQSLEESVRGILDRSDNYDVAEANRKREAYESELQSLREELAALDKAIFKVRESETDKHVVADGAYQGTAAAIVKEVNAVAEEFQWFEDDIRHDATCPEITDGLMGVLKGLRRYTADFRNEIELDIPSGLLPVEEFEFIVNQESLARDEVDSLRSEVDEPIMPGLSTTDLRPVEQLIPVLQEALNVHKELDTLSFPWVDGAVRDVLGGNAVTWKELERVTNGAVSALAEKVAHADDITLEYPSHLDPKIVYEDGEAIRGHLANGGGLGWGPFRAKVVKDKLYLLSDVKVGGKVCNSLEQFTRLSETLHIRMEIDKAWRYWTGKHERPAGPYATQLTTLRALGEASNKLIELEEKVALGRAILNDCHGVREPDWANALEIARCHRACKLSVARTKLEDITSNIKAIDDRLAQSVAGARTHPVAEKILSAIRNRDIDAYRAVLTERQEVLKHREFVNKMDRYVAELRPKLPRMMRLMEATADDVAWEGRINNFSNAWQWARAKDWIREEIENRDYISLATRSSTMEKKIGKTVAKIAALNAWSICLSRLKDEHKRHMEAWQISMRRLGKGTGKHAPRYRRDAQHHLEKCREAIPVWVMPLHRVWDTVSPKAEIFDVVIVDEASQCGFEALPLFYIGKKIVIVGDDKQISPEPVGVDLSTVAALQNKYLYDFALASTFALDSSLFDHGKLLYDSQRITLREHFRCMPEIIAFSNDLCYSSTPLIPLRQYGPNRLEPLENHFVENGYREGSGSRVINKPEAQAIVDKICELCDDEKYDDKTMGVVVLQGEKQASLVEQLLFEQLGPKEINERRLVCGDPYSFQGDERDVMLLSLVAAPNVRIGTLSKSPDERRFNVAASRARDQLILYHSVTTNDLSALCLRRRLLEHFEQKQPRMVAGLEQDELERIAYKAKRNIDAPPAPFDSWFEVDVALQLVRKGYDVRPQFEFAGKRIDLVVEGGQARLAVECYGDYWHGGAVAYERDAQRQRQLERCGWEFFIVWESTFYANKEKALEKLWDALEERRITPRKLNGDMIADEGNVPSEALDSTNEPMENASDDTSPAPIIEERGDQTNSRNVADVSAGEIRESIIRVLANRPNNSCAIHSLTAEVLRDLGILTRGNPRQAFERRVKQAVSYLERGDKVQRYQAKNKRVRLL